MKILFYLFAVLIFTVLNIGHPVTPNLLNEINVDENMFGYVFGVMSLGLTIASPFWGSKGDQKGRKLYFLIGCIGYAIGQTIFAFSTDIYVLLFGRFVSGFMAAAIVVNFYAYVLENTEKKDRSSVISVVGACSAIALSLGYYLGGLFGENIGTKETLYIQIISSVVLGIMMYFTFTKRNTEEKERLSVFQSLATLKDVSNKNVAIMLIALLIASLAYQTAPKFIDLMFTSNGYTSEDLGIFVFITGIVAIPVTFLLVYPIAKRINLSLLLVITLFGASIALFLTFAVYDDFILSLYTMYMLHFIFKTFHEPIDIANLSNSSDLDSGILMGIRNSFKSIAQVIGPIIGGYIYAYNVNLLFYVCSVLLLIAAVIMMGTLRKAKV